jgi:two-component sensor histidine kinase
VEPYSSRGEDRLHLSGPDVRLSPRMALALAMALQELATNAVKYGALSNEAGRIVVRGERVGDALTLIWEERGGPPVAGPPERQGFGALMTSRTVSGQLGGALVSDWHRDGLTMKLTVPLANLTK